MVSNVRLITEQSGNIVSSNWQKALAGFIHDVKFCEQVKMMNYQSKWNQEKQHILCVEAEDDKIIHQHHSCTAGYVPLFPFSGSIKYLQYNNVFSPD